MIRQKLSSLYYAHKVSQADIDLWPRDSKSTGFFLSSFTICKCSEHGEVCIMPASFYTQSAKIDLNLELTVIELNPMSNPKSIRLLLSSSTTSMRSFKVIGLKLSSVLCPKGFIHRVPKMTLTFDSKSIGFLLSSLTTYMLSLKIIEL